MGTRSFLGELEEMVLLAALGLGAEAYGASVLRALDDEAGRGVSRGSVYVAIDRLEGKGLIETHAGEATPGRRGRPRRMIRVTEMGVEALRRSHQVRSRLRESIEEVLS